MVTKHSAKKSAQKPAQKPSKTNVDVIVVGAGPVGLALAKGLALDGRSVVVLEKKTSLSQHSKALTLWAGTQDVVERLGLLPVFEDHSLCRDRMQIFDADHDRALTDLPLFELSSETAHARLLLLPQNVTETLFFESLAEEEKAEVKFGATVTGLTDEEDGVSVRYVQDGKEHELRSRFAIGCDGAHSVVRAALGFHLEGETYKIKAGLSDIELGDTKIDYAFPRFTSEAGFAIAIKASETLWRLIFIERADKEWDLTERTEAAVEKLFGQTSFKPLWTSEFKLHRRTSERFSKGNLVLAGDAAHLNSPIGGQGMNAGIQDTEPLRKALALAFAENSNEPLHDYAIKRKAEVEKGVNRWTGFMTSLLFARHGRYLRDVLRTLDVGFKIPAVRHAFLRRAMMLNRF